MTRVYELPDSRAHAHIVLRCRPIGTRSYFSHLPSTYVLGFPVPPLRGFSCNCLLALREVWSAFLRLRDSKLLHKLTLSAASPRVVRNREAHAVRNRGMAVEEEHVYGIRIGIGQANLAEDLEGARSHLA